MLMLGRYWRETLSSFSNTPGGGVIVLGVDEKTGFDVVGVSDPRTIQAKVMGLCADTMDPPIRPLIETHEIDGTTVITVEVPELDLARKPCFYKGAGPVNGSYRRVGDGDHRMTPYEVHQLIAGRGQPRDDQEPVPEATREDLDPDAVRRLLARLRDGVSSFAEDPDATLLRRLRVLVDHEGRTVPSVGGLLALGRYPQEFFPQLNVTFVHYPDLSGPTAEQRFIDNQSIDGPIPVLVREALRVVRANMSRGAVIIGPGREDVWEYPIDAVREAVVNAIVHRDYSPMARGSQIQIEMYPDRLMIRNAGGLFGPVTREQLGDGRVSSSRNATLLRLLEDIVLPANDRPICENRGSGIPIMLRTMKSAGLSPPLFDDQVATFTVTFPNHTLMDAEAMAWLKSLGQEGLTDTQAQALVHLRDGETLTNSTYRGRFVLDSRVVTQELGDLVRRGLVAQEGSRRWAVYQLAESLDGSQPAEGSVLVAEGPRRTLRLLVEGWTPTRAELAEALGQPDRTVRDWLGRLRNAAPPMVERLGAQRSPTTRYRVTQTGIEAMAALGNDEGGDA
jgi:ATP-dependent DNA helicase RecG